MDTLRWLRIFGDTLFAAGAVVFVTAIARVTFGAPKSVPSTTEGAVVGKGLAGASR